MGNINHFSTDKLLSIKRSISEEIERRTLGIIHRSQNCFLCEREYLESHMMFGENAYVCRTCYDGSYELKMQIHSWFEWQGDIGHQIFEEEAARKLYTLCKEQCQTLGFLLRHWHQNGYLHDNEERSLRRLDEIDRKIAELIGDNYPRIMEQPLHNMKITISTPSGEITASSLDLAQLLIRAISTFQTPHEGNRVIIEDQEHNIIIIVEATDA